MPDRTLPARPDLTLDDLPELMTLAQAAAAVRMNEHSLRVAIKAGELAAFIPRGRDPLRSGRGQGYRIRREDLQRWYFKDV